MVFNFLFKGKAKNQERAVPQQYWGPSAMDPPRVRNFTLKTSMPPASLPWGDSNEPSQETEHRFPGWPNVHGKHWRFSGLDVTQQPAISNYPQLPKDKAAAGGDNVIELNQQNWPEDQAANPNPQAETIKNNPDNLEEMTISENKADSEQQSHSRKPEIGNANGAHRLPPESVLVKPFDGFKSFDALSPSIDTSAQTSSGLLESASSGSGKVVAEKPTCSLSLICYSRGCSIGQVTVTLRDKFKFGDGFAIALAKTPKLITDDEQLFERLRYEYLGRMCGFWRRNFSLKTLRRLRLLSYTENTRPTPVPMDDLTMQEVLYAFNHPSQAGHGTDWIEWIFRLRQPGKRHALEFVEGWNGTRIAIVGLLPCLASTLVGVIWSARGGDVQTAFTVAGFILTVTTVLIALLAVVSSIDSKAY